MTENRDVQSEHRSTRKESSPKKIGGNRNFNQGRKKSRGRGKPRKEKFNGREEALRSHIFYFTTSRHALDSFQKTTKKYETGSYIRLVIEKLKK